MQFSIVWVALALVFGFAFGFAIAFLADKAMMAKWRRDALYSQSCVESLARSCRDVLADSWYKKVMRRYEEYANYRRRCAHD